MTQADSVHSTPPTNTPVDTARRRFLSVAAGAIAATAITTSTAAPAIDPIFDLIEAHRKAGRDHVVALVEQERLERIGDKAADLAGEAPCHAEFKAFDVLLAAAATTLPGILAKLAYLQDIAEREAWMFDDRKGSAAHLIESFVASIANIIAALSGSEA
jgi:hypothetical protein